MSSVSENDGITKELCSVVSSYLDVFVSTPALETVTRDFEGQAQIAMFGTMLHVVAHHIRNHGINYDRQYLASLPQEEIQARIELLQRASELQEAQTDKAEEIVSSAMDCMNDSSSRKYLIEYLIREINWIIVSLLSASYISAFVLMRSVFELIVGMATRKTGGITDRINSIQELDDQENKKVKKQWGRLCAWVHPFGKWQKEVCPIYISHKPLYHPKLFSLCSDEFVDLLDFFLVVAVT